MASTTGPRGAVTAFPTSAESLALQASLLDGDAARQAWRKLSSTTGPEGAGIAWIAPLLMANLERLVPDDPWVKGNPHFLTLAQLKARAITKSAEAILDCLSVASVPTLALKGLALGATVYDSPGLRTVSDLDILAPGRDLFRAMEALKKRGLRSGPGEPSGPADLRAHHAHVFYSPKRRGGLVVGDDRIPLAPALQRFGAGSPEVMEEALARAMGCPGCPCDVRWKGNSQPSRRTCGRRSVTAA